jgi:murein DD-endopeptidase MepM/ murein hydrolase activator NlpD
MSTKKRPNGLTDREVKYIRDRRAHKLLNPVPGFRVSTAWRKRGSGWSLGYHTGEDHACPVGTPLVAVTWGHVIGVGWGGAPHALGSDYGNVVIIEKQTGDYEYFYAHMSRFNVRLGDAVKPGQVIGWSGNTGHTTGPHCHFEARPLNGTFGTDVNPKFVRQAGFTG